MLIAEEGAGEREREEGETEGEREGGREAGRVPFLSLSAPRVQPGDR